MHTWAERNQRPALTPRTGRVVFVYPKLGAVFIRRRPAQIQVIRTPSERLRVRPPIDGRVKPARRAIKPRSGGRTLREPASTVFRTDRLGSQSCGVSSSPVPSHCGKSSPMVI